MKITEINEIQRYLIGGFVEYGYSQDYRDILPKEIFWIYAPLYSFLSENGNAKTPDFYRVCNSIGNKFSIEAIDRSDVSFLSERDKYIEQLLNYYVTESLSKGKTPLELLESVKDTYVKLALLKSQNTWGLTSIETLCSSLWEEICNPEEKKKWYKTGIPCVDTYTGGLIKGRTIRLSAYSNTGKSAMSYAVCNSALRQWAKVLYFSLEIPKEDLRNRLISNYYEIPMSRFDNKSTLEDLDLTNFSKLPLLVSCDTFSISEIEKLVESSKPDVVIIDYVQILKWEWTSEYEQMNDVARRIRKMTAQNDVAVFDLSQVSNDWMKYIKGGVIPSKWSGELISAANVVLVMTESKNPGKLNLHIAKNRHGKKWSCFELKPDFSISKFEEICEVFPNYKKF